MFDSAEDDDEVDIEHADPAYSISHQDPDPTVDNSGATPVESNAPPYSLRPSGNVHYSAAAMPDEITTSDEPSVNEALKSPERSEWLSAIKQEFATLTANGTWKPGTPPSGIRPLPSGGVLRLKRETQQVVREGSRLVLLLVATYSPM